MGEVATSGAGVSVALGGVTVLDLCESFWSQSAAAMLADFGARVIRIDDAAQSDRADDVARDAAFTSWNYQYDLANRNKLSLGLALGSETGRAMLAALAAKVDVVVTDWPRARLKECDLDYASLAAAREDIIYARGSGFGPKGPDADLPAIDELAAARTGMMPILPQPGQPPLYGAHGCMYSSVMLAYAVAVALFHRRRSGQGQEVDVSLFGGNMYGASLDLQAYLAIGGERMLEPVSRLDAGNPMSGVLYPASDGRWIALTMPDTDRWWPLLCEVTGLDPDDSRFDSHDKRCGAHRLELIEALEEAIGAETSSHWRGVFRDKQMSADVIEGYEYPAADQAAIDNRYILDLDDASIGRLRMLGFPLFMTDTPARLRRSAPCAGQHSDELLCELLGYSEHDIVGLRSQGVIL